MKSPYPNYKTSNPLLSDHANDLDIFLDKPFWIWDVQEYKREDNKCNGDCCFNHIIDLLHYDKEKYKEVTLDAAEIVLGIFGLDLLRGIRTSIRV